MAVYAADIRVGVVGLPALTKLGKALDQCTKKTKALNAELQKVKRAIKAPTISVNTSRALSDIQKVNRELDKLNSRKVAPTVGSRGGGGGSGRRLAGASGALGKGLLTGAGFGLAGTAGGLASVAAQALNPITLLGAGLGVAAVAALDYGKAAAIAAGETQRFETALRALTVGDDYVKALEAIEETSNRFFTTIPETTKQFTKLTAATTANGLSIEDTKNVYQGLAAANVALGGDAERLNGILLATQQIFSKGKVQAEELRGQIGERLSGAFALFAQSSGISLKELDKNLERGEVNVEQFVKFSQYLLKQFGDTADEQLGKSELAGQRLGKAFSDLQLKIGRLLQPLGAAIQDWATGVVESLDKIVTKLMEILDIGEDAVIKNIKILEEEKNELLAKIGGPFGKRDPNAEAQLRLIDSRLKKLRREKAIIDEMNKGTGKKSKLNKPKEEEEGDKPKTPAQLERERLRALKAEESRLNQLRSREQSLEIAKAELAISMEDNKFKQVQLRLEQELLKIRIDSINAILRAKSEEEKTVIKAETEIRKLIARREATLDFEDIMTDAGKALGEGLAESMQELEDMRDMFKTFWTDIAQSLPEDPLDTALNASVDSLKVALEDSIVGVLDVAINRAEDLGEVLTDIGRQLLSDVGRLFINAAINQIPFPTFDSTPPGLANGGPMTGGQPYVVGERGPELIVPAQAGTVYNANAFDAARASMQSTGQTEATNSAVAIEAAEAEAPLAPSDITVRYETSVINAVSYVTDEQFQKGMRDSANQARALTYKELRNRPAIRAKAGVR